MPTKTILGLDLGTNSIGWALVALDSEKHEGKILGMGSRIIPMSQDILNTFGSGGKVSQTAERTNYRSARRLRERHLLRRERLHRVLHVLKFLPDHYASQIDFEHRLGKFLPSTEPKLPYDTERHFIFKTSFNEMLADFRINQPGILKNVKGENISIPYDWTIYFLRKKALTQRIEKEELAWIILNFNQKRGYYQLRGEENDESPNKTVEYHSLRIIAVTADENPNSKGDTWYTLTLENGWQYRRTNKTSLTDWIGKIKDFIVTTDINPDGSVKKDKSGNEKRSIHIPSEENWTLLKKKTERDIETSGKTVGEYIYDTLLKDPRQKIKGKLVRTIERSFYKKELQQILETQRKFHPEFSDKTLFNACITELYKNNETQQSTLSKKDLIHLFIEDIIFYQRPLKSKKSSISNCTMEFRKYRDFNGNEQTKYLKVAPKSNPLYQEFRVWQWLSNLRIYRKEDDIDVTADFIKGIGEVENLFDFLMDKKEIGNDDILTYFITPIIKNKFPDAKPTALKKEITKEIHKYRWNYVYDESKDQKDEKPKKYPMNETGYEIRRRLKTVKNIDGHFLTPNIEYQLWHIIYSVTDKIDYKKALDTFAIKHGLDQTSFIDAFEKFPPFKSDYGAYSEKALKRLLPLLRTGKYWNWDAIDKNTQTRISKIINGEYDETIKGRVRDKSIHLTKNSDFQGLQLWLAIYIIYDEPTRTKWESIDDLNSHLQNFKQHSLRNPIVEQIVTETLRIVADIWRRYGNETKDFLDEIHVELGREMKNTSEERKRISDKIAENEATNLRIKALLSELADDSRITNVRPYSPMQQEALKIYEDGVINSGLEIPDDIVKISKMNNPSKRELTRYKLWLEQKYRSPYTGNVIPLSKLFTKDYEIEHIIPQSRFFDDSFTNKVICESAVNKLKDNQTGMEFIKNHHGEILMIKGSRTIRIFTEEEYKEFIKQNYSKTTPKRLKLLLEDIPEKMIERQLNDTRYITRFISSELSNLVREDNNDNGASSKNLILGNGRITSILRQDWGLNDIWNDLILPRFERMNTIHKCTSFTTYNEKYQKNIPSVPIEYSKNFQKKRIDHRHHAMDALVIACTTRDHVNLLNNLYARSPHKRYDLQRKLRIFEMVRYRDSKTNEQIEKEVPKDFIKPWNTFTADTKSNIEQVIVSFKANLRIINKASNRYEKWIDKNGSTSKELVSNATSNNWAIRKPLHKETVSGKVTLPRINVPKGKILTATRKSVNTSLKPKDIYSITDTGIQKILVNYLSSKENDPTIAFSPEGLEEMNAHIEDYNNGKPHKPINKVRIFELGSKFQLGQSGNKKDKYVEAAKGTNLFFAVYRNHAGNRTFDTIPLNIVIERQKQGMSSVPETDENENRLLFHLSPNDLIYIPTEEEVEGGTIFLSPLTKDQIGRIYKVVSFTGSRLFAIPVNVASSIVNKLEYTQLNKIELTKEKQVCIKLAIDRLGNTKVPVIQ